jgi:hypothetical protein
MNHRLERLETRAEKLRLRAGAKAFERLDPFRLAQVMGIEVLRPKKGMGIPTPALNQLLREAKDSWDAGTLALPNGMHQIILNPTRSVTRQNATLMEEIAHIELGHQPSQFPTFGGITLRSFDRQCEKEAYNLGAAALVPKRLLMGASTLGLSVEQLAAELGVSQPRAIRSGPPPSGQQRELYH